MKNVAFPPDLHRELLVGVELAERTIGATLGPAGGTSLLSREFGRRTATKDGYHTAREIKCADEDWLAQMGVEAVVNGCARQAMVGDGTSSTAVMTAELYRGAVKLLAGGVSPTRLAREVEAAGAKVASWLDHEKMDPYVEGRLFGVAMTSTNGDAELSAAVVRATEHLGGAGLWTRRRGIGIETRVELANGVMLPLKLSDPKAMIGAEVQLDAAKTLVVRGEVQGFPDGLKRWVQANIGAAMVIIGGGFSQQTKAAALRVAANGVNLLLLEPNSGSIGDEVLLDVEAVTGAKMQNAVALDGLSFDDLVSGEGMLNSVQIGQQKIIVLGATGDLSGRVESANALAKSAETNAERKLHSDRAANLLSRVAHLWVGAETEGALGERYDAAEDALLACAATVKGDGVLTGGGVSLLRARAALDGDESDAARLMRAALAAPFRWLAENGGHSYGEVIAAAINAGGFDPVTGEAVNMNVRGVYDPALVLIGAVKAAASAAAELIKARVAVYSPKVSS